MTNNITEKKLLTNKKGEMFIVDSIKTLKYRGEEHITYVCFNISDSGLINKTKEKKSKQQKLEINSLY